VPPPPPLPPAQLGFRPALVKGTLTGKKNPPGFPTLKTMKVQAHAQALAHAWLILPRNEGQ
jgi:hypothetical protein